MSCRRGSLGWRMWAAFAGGVVEWPWTPTQSLRQQLDLSRERLDVAESSTAEGSVAPTCIDRHTNRNCQTVDATSMATNKCHQNYGPTK